MTAIRATELEYEATIIEAAKMAGWLVHAERAAVSKGKWSTPIKGHAGFPDLVMVHTRFKRLLIVELKRKPNKVSVEQHQWLEALGTFNSIDMTTMIVWVPEQVPQLLHQLANPSRPILEEDY